MKKSKLFLLPAFLLLLTACGNNNPSTPVDPGTDPGGDPADPGTDPGQERTLESIEIKTPATTLEFEVGDEFDYQGLVVEAVYSDETRDVINSWGISTPDMTTAGEKTVTISYKGKTVTYTITVNAKPISEDPVNAVSGAETDAVTHKDTWIYWNVLTEYNLNANVEVNEGDVTSVANKKIEATYKATAGECDFGFQLFFKDSSLNNGVKYKQTFTITSAVATTVEFINAKVDLAANTPTEMEIHYWQTEGISFKAVFKTVAGQENHVVIDNLATEGSNVLDAPLNISVNEEFVINFTEAVNATTYQIKVEDEEGQLVEGFSELAVTKGQAIPGFADLADGIYKIYVRSLADGLVTSEWSNPVTVAKGDAEADPFKNYDEDNKDFVFGEQGTAVNNPGTLYYWNDHINWCGSNVTINRAQYVNKGIEVDFKVEEGACDWGLQIFFKNEFLKNGTKYTISFTLDTEVGGKIGYNGTDNASVDVIGGANKLSREYTEVAAGASLVVAIPTTLVKGDGTNSIRISDISWVEVK